MQRLKDLAAEYAYLVMLVCVICVIVGSAAYTQQLRKEERQPHVEAAAGAPEIGVSAQPSATVKTTPLPTIAPLAVRVSVLEEKTVWPIEGAVRRHHDMQEHVYWETLDVWQVHAGTDIAGEPEQNVCAAGRGRVIRAARDALWGGSIEIEQEDGRTVSYRGLALLYVKEGDEVARGQEIGTLLEYIPCEAEMGAHLHLEVMRGGVMQDPLAMLPER